MYKELNKKILRLAIPSILANLTIPLVGLVDLAISGHIGDAVMISGIAVGSMLFDLLYWNFGFLRMGTSGFVAQAYGKRDLRESVKVFMEATATALVSAVIILLLQFPLIHYLFEVVKVSPEAADFARQYFLIRVWAAPAVMVLFVIRGWLIGMQNSVSPMIIDIVVNGTHILFSVILAIPLGMGIKGIALGTVSAQYVGLLTGTIILVVQYGKLRKYIQWSAVQLRRMKHFFMVSGDIMIRSVCMQVIYNGMLIFSSQFGEEMLAINTILLKLILIYTFTIDGFAYAGEALAGRYIGAKDRINLSATIKLLFIWGTAIGLVFTAFYATGFNHFIQLITSDPNVIFNAGDFFWWVIAVPIMSCFAFMWDGIYIGATASAPMRNIMVVSVLFFLVTYFLFGSTIGAHALWLAYILHLVVRTAGCQLLAKKSIYARVGQSAFPC